jgi:ABC-type Fe3+ transport system permease subunit
MAAAVAVVMILLILVPMAILNKAEAKLEEGKS